MPFCSVTVLTGARQTGKTTLVRDLLPAAGGPPSIYISLDDPDERLRLAADPVRRLEHGMKLVVLDEVQKQPGLLYWTDPGLARLLAERADLSNGALFETAVLDELLRWSSWQPEPPSINFFRTRAGREVDFVLRGASRIVAIEAKAGRQASRADAGPLIELLEGLRLRVGPGGESRLGLVVTRGREIGQLAPGVWAIPDWRLFGPAA